MSSGKIGVLVFPAGEINSVELHDALSTCVNIRLYGASSVDRHGEFIFRNYIDDVPMISDSTFFERFNKILIDHLIDVIIPTHDDVVLFLAENQERIKAKILTCDIRTAKICRDKKLTFDLFNDCDFCPTLYFGISHLPVFIKPRKGQGGVGARLINSEHDITVEIDIGDYVICEYLPGSELTVDCFTNKDGELQAILPRSRQRIFGGVSARSSNEELTEEIKNIAETINSRLRFLGLWSFQIKQSVENKYKLLEISARCAGTMCLSRALGVNLPMLSVYAAMGRATEVFSNGYDITVDRTLISRYKPTFEYEKVYIDLDDTIIVNGRVNLQAIRFLYQCSNDNREIVLITRHTTDHDDSVLDTLNKHKIPISLFDEIIELTADTPKFTAIESRKAIFIDNAYAERKSAHDNLNIPVFDVDGIEVLLDWRT